MKVLSQGSCEVYVHHLIEYSLASREILVKYFENTYEIG